MTMKNPGGGFEDDRAVSPLIGAILMIGLTFVVATVVGGFVVGIGEDLNQPIPDTGIDFEYNSTSEQVTTYHGGGKLLSQSNTGEMHAKGDYSGGGEWNSDTFSAPLDQEEATVSSTINSTDLLWQSETGAVTSGETVRIVWVSPSGKKSEQLGRFTAP